jgi:hypothetical protein
VCKRALQQEIKKQRRSMLGAVHEHIRKYISRLPAYVVSIGPLSDVTILTTAVLYGPIADCGTHRSLEPISA